LGQRFESGIRKENGRQTQRKAAGSVRDKRRVVRWMNRKQAGNYQDEDRDAQQRAHRDLDSAEPTDADHMNQVKENQTADCQRLMCKFATDTTPAQLDYVVGQRARQISARADVRDDLE